MADLMKLAQAIRDSVSELSEHLPLSEAEREKIDRRHDRASRSRCRR